MGPIARCFCCMAKLKPALAFGVAFGITTLALAGEDPTSRATRLPPLLLDTEDGFSVRRYEIETGVYYKWRIESDGFDEYKLIAPELFRNSWIDQVVIEDREVKPYGLHAVEFDDEGAIDIWFIVQRPGEYEFTVEGFEDLGFTGVFSVR